MWQDITARLGALGAVPFSLWVCVPPGPDFPKNEED